ncbi:MAG: protein kinase, partial [Acidobacteriota bacterium]
MEPERWRRAEQIFDAALDVDTGERRDFVTASCAADPDLADEVLQMLAADRRLDGGLSTARAGEDADFLAKAVLGGQSLLSQGDLEALGSPPPVESPSTGDPGALDPGALDSGALDPGVLDPGSLDPGSLDAEAAELDAEGRAFGKYRLLEKIGAGGFGQVYRASDAVLGREVAIKTCTSADPRLRQRFLREAKISAALQHPNIVTVFDFGFRDGVPFLVQELLPGEDLSQPIARRLSLPVETVEGILLDIARGLAHAHDQGVLHRDVKPGNVRLLPDGTVKLLDFGIARLRDHKSGITSEGVTLGTVGYLAPEQLSGRNEDERSDIFAFGVLAYELLCFEKPFVGETFSQVSYQLLFEAPPPLRDRTDGVRGPVLSTVDRCLQKSPEDRHASFHDVIRALESEVAAPPDAASALSEPAA